MFAIKVVTITVSDQKLDIGSPGNEAALLAEQVAIQSL